jgi:ADP-ribosylglycohydrolase
MKVVLVDCLIYQGLLRVQRRRAARSQTVTHHHHQDEKGSVACAPSRCRKEPKIGWYWTTALMVGRADVVKVSGSWVETEILLNVRVGDGEQFDAEALVVDQVARRRRADGKLLMRCVGACLDLGPRF